LSYAAAAICYNLTT